MPAKNRVKEYDVNSYYHIYNRGVNKRAVFKDDQDYSVFMNLLKRYLSKQVQRDNYGRIYENYSQDIELLSFCLMPNHFHLLVYQKENWRAIEHIMRQVSIAYVMYFNKRYKRVGPLFQDRYKASRIDNEAYLQHISRYIHLNPKNYKHYEWSSYQAYSGKKQYDWLQKDKIIGIFDSKDKYIHFIDNFNDYKETLELVEMYKAG